MKPLVPEAAGTGSRTGLLVELPQLQAAAPAVRTVLNHLRPGAPAAPPVPLNGKCSMLSHPHCRALVAASKIDPRSTPDCVGCGVGVGLDGFRGFQEPVGAGVGEAGSVGSGVGVGLGGPVGPGLGAGAGWAGTGLDGTGTGVRLGGSADGTVGTWTEIDGAETRDGSTAAGPCGECCAGSAAVWPDLALGVAADGDAAKLGEVPAVVEGTLDCVDSWLSALVAPWVCDSWPKKGNSRAWLTEAAANKMPKAPVTTAIRLLIVRMVAAFLRTACGSRLNDEPVNDAGPTAAPGAGGSGVVAAFSILAGSAVAGSAVSAVTVGAATVGMAAVAGSAVSAATVGVATVGVATVGMAAVSLAWEALFRSAARAAARVVGTAVVGVAVVVGSAVEIKGSEAGAAMNGSLSLARRRPVGLMRSRATWARRGRSMVGDMVIASQRLRG